MVLRPRHARRAALLVAAVLACRFDATGLGEAGDGDGDGDGATSQATTLGGGSSGDTNSVSASEASASDSGTTGPVLPDCGDGDLDPGEACDAGPGNVGGLACTPGCAQNECGDGYVGAGEQCDGAAVDGATCTPACTKNLCGDGFVGDAEQCDEGPANSDHGACTHTCMVARCGDGLIGPGEACDDANNKNDDACVDMCEPATCGDGYLQLNVETCDLGAVNGTYGSLCNVTCNGPGPRCGDGVVDPMHETCDGDPAANHTQCAACQVACDDDYGDCNDSPGDGCEAWLLFDNNHCGECGNKCPQGKNCFTICV